MVWGEEGSPPLVARGHLMGKAAANKPKGRARQVRCAIYTRKSSEEGLEQEFNSLDAQRESCEAYIQSQRGQGWEAVSARYDDGGFSGGGMKRPALEGSVRDGVAAGASPRLVSVASSRRSPTGFPQAAQKRPLSRSSAEQ